MNDDTLNLLLLIAFIAIIAIGSATFSWMSCASKASVMQKEYSYGIMSGCMIKTGKGFIPLKNMRGFEE